MGGLLGSYLCCPARLEAPVVEVEKLTQSEETRRRLKFLGHIPLTAEFQLVEVDLSGIVPAEALVPFVEELTARHKRRQRKAKSQAREAAKDARRKAAEARSQQARPGSTVSMCLSSVHCLPSEAGHAALVEKGIG